MLKSLTLTAMKCHRCTRAVHIQDKRVCDLCNIEAANRSIIPTKSYHAGTPNQNGKEMSDLWTGGKLRAIFLRTIVDCGIDCSTCCGVSCRRCIWSYWSDTGHRSHSSKPARTSSVSAGTECHGVRWKAKMIKVMKKDAGRLLGARWVRSFDQYLSIFGIEAIGQWLINEECCMK